MAFGRLSGNVWKRNGNLTLSRNYTRLWYCQTSYVHVHFNSNCLRKFLTIRWQHKIQNKEILKKAGMQSLHTFLKLTQLRWTGHVTRMPDERLPNKVSYGELQEGERFQCGQTKSHKDTNKASLKDFNIKFYDFH